MLTLSDYLRDPCGTLSIPYWKHKSIRMPDHMRILHQREFDPALLTGYADAPYFRLMHDLTHIHPGLPEWLSLRTAERADIPCMADIINASYTDLSVTAEQLRGYAAQPAYAPDLWLLACDLRTGEAIGCGIAALDPETGEGSLEWIQVLPAWRRQGVGRTLVNHLLLRMKGKAAFATVSGKADAPSAPERLYRSCGFTGQDLWHILTHR